MKLFLSHAGMSEVIGGIEVYASHLKRVFDDLELVDYHSHKTEIGDTGLAPFREPFRAERLAKLVAKKYSKADAIFTNGMFCWDLYNKNQYNICHGTYSAFAEKAVPKSSLDYYRLKFIYSHYEKKAACNAKKVIANSRQTQENVKKYFGLDSEIIHPPVDMDVFQSMGKEEAMKKIGWSGKNILFVGRPEYAKGFDFVEALAKLNPELSFKAILSRPYTSLISNLEVLPQKNYEELPDYYNAAELVLFPSRFEGYGLVVMEALACNRRVLTLNTGIASELKSNNLVVSLPNIERLNLDMRNLLKVSERYSRAIFNDDFSFTAFKKKWKKLLE